MLSSLPQETSSQSISMAACQAMPASIPFLWARTLSSSNGVFSHHTHFLYLSVGNDQWRLIRPCKGLCQQASPYTALALVLPMMVTLE